MAGNIHETLGKGAAKVAHCWLLERCDGLILGFTDHDRDLTFDNYTFSAGSGLTGAAIERSLGLSVDNAEAIGALSDARLKEEDIRAGLYDGAGVQIWLVNWSDVAEKRLLFKGTLGEIERSGGEFRAEIRGQVEKLNQPCGRVLQSFCDARLGNTACGIDLTLAAYKVDTKFIAVAEARIFTFSPLKNYSENWFQHGRLKFTSGAAKGLEFLIVQDEMVNGKRVVTLSQSVRAKISAADKIQLIAGCDKTSESCQKKFSNFLNFQGFPHLPGDDWLMGYPREGSIFDGGRLAR